MALMNAIFDPMLDGGAAVAVTASLHSTQPNGTGSGELTGGGYERQSVSWASANGGSVSTSGPITFNVDADTTVTHVGLWDADDTWLGSLELEAPETFASAGTLTADPLTISLSN